MACPGTSLSAPRTSPSMRGSCGQRGACPSGRWCVQTPSPTSSLPRHRILVERMPCGPGPGHLHLGAGWAGDITTGRSRPRVSTHVLPHAGSGHHWAHAERTYRGGSRGSGLKDWLGARVWGDFRAQLPDAFDVRISGGGRGGKEMGVWLSLPHVTTAVGDDHRLTPAFSLTTGTPWQRRPSRRERRPGGFRMT